MSTKTFIIQPDFTSGELSQRLYKRTDLDTFKSGVRKLRNAYVVPTGNIVRRQGTEKVGTLNDQTKEGRLIPLVYSRDVSYLLVFNNGKFQVIKRGVFIDDGASGVTNEFTTGDNLFEVAVPYTESEIKELTYAQIANTLFITHKNYPPKFIRVTSDTSWTFADVEFEYRAMGDIPFQSHYIEFEIINGATDFAVGDSFTIDSSGTVTASLSPENTGDGTIGGVFINPDGPTQTFFVSCVYVKGDRFEFEVTGSVTGLIQNPWGANDYPSTVTIYEQRMIFGGTATQPQTLWLSKAGNFTILTVGYDDADGMNLTVAADQLDQITHLVSGRSLIVLTYGGEFTITGSSTKGITPSTYRIVAQTRHGSSYARPIRVGDEILFVPRSGNVVRAINSIVTEDLANAPDVSILSEHLVKESVVDMTFSQAPNYTCNFITSEGALLNLVHIRDYSITAWSRSHTTDGTFERATSIPEGDTDVVYAIVKRTIDGTDYRFIERFLFNDEYFMDCAIHLTAEGSPLSKTWGGLEHLEGQTVAIVDDEGYNYAPQVVENGEITIGTEVSGIKVGIPYTTTIELLHPDLPVTDGTTSQGRNLRISSIVLTLKDTPAVWVDDQLYASRTFGSFFDQLPEPIQGDVSIPLNGWSHDRAIKIEQSLPYPLEVLSVVLKGVVND